jgi:hypothetical protein
MTTTINGTTGIDKVKDSNAAPFLPFTKEYVSAEQTITSGGSLTLSHGLGGRPKLFNYSLVCKSAEGGYSVNDEVDWMTVQYYSANTVNAGFVNTPDATNINIRFGDQQAAVIYLLNKSTGSAFSITPASWRLVVRAWA